MKYFINALMIALLASAPLGADESLSARVEIFLKSRVQRPAATGWSEEARLQILARSDPGTFFLRYAFGLKQHANQLLSQDQAAQLLTVIDKHSQAQLRWHDERNTLRCKFNEQMWRYAAADNAESPKLRAELSKWMRLRMEWTRLEHLAQYRFARDVWNVLDAAQQQKLIAGDWKAYAKQDTGHTRSDATAKLITRALGKPDNQPAFEVAVAGWSKKRLPLQEAVMSAEHAERRIVFAMDLNSESMVQHANQAATDAYAALYLAEAEAIRAIVQIGYTNPAPGCVKAAAEAWGEAPTRFQHGANELIQLLLSKP